MTFIETNFTAIALVIIFVILLAVLWHVLFPSEEARAAAAQDWPLHDIPFTDHDAAVAVGIGLRAGPHEDLSMDKFAAISFARALRWHKGGLEDWGIADWSNAMCGEAGEVANAVKKLRRIECSMQQHGGDSGTPKDRADAIVRIGKEIGDTYTYLDLLAQRLGLRMSDCARLAFNSVSERESFPERV